MPAGSFGLAVFALTTTKTQPTSIHPTAMNTKDAPDSMPSSPVQPLEIAVRSLRSPTGHGRLENQDNYLVIDGQGQARMLWRERETTLRLPDWPPGHRRLAVLDGMGGHSHGREAAENTVEGLLDLPAAANLASITRDLDALHRRLHRQYQAAGLETGCTLILLEIPPAGPALLFHVGDSRVYAVSAQRVQCLTVDHVPATHMAMLGLVDGTQWMQRVHVQTNSQISQAFVLGSTLGAPQLYAEAITEELFELHEGNLPLFLRGLGDRRTLKLEPGWVYLLASDGLWHLSDPQAFIQRWPTLIGRPQCPLEELADALLAELAGDIRRQRSQPDDNCTFILARRPGGAEDRSLESVP
jgi:serine/threonine protein phosphatase PrpC